MLPLPRGGENCSSYPDLLFANILSEDNWTLLLTVGEWLRLLCQSEFPLHGPSCRPPTRENFLDWWCNQAITLPGLSLPRGLALYPFPRPNAQWTLSLSLLLWVVDPCAGLRHHTPRQQRLHCCTFLPASEHRLAHLFCFFSCPLSASNSSAGFSRQVFCSFATSLVRC